MSALIPIFAVLLIADPEAAEEIKVADKIVEIEDDGKSSISQFDEMASEAETITITSERCDFDREHSVVMFEGKALVNYSNNYFIGADRLFAFFALSNELDRIIASGDVVISNDTRLGRCESAVFKRRLGEIEMYGGAEGSLARLAELGSDEIAGRRIKFWVDSEQVEIGGSELTFEKGKNHDE